MLLSRLPLYLATEAAVLVRLACIKRTASVRPEPGSNSKCLTISFHYPVVKVQNQYRPRTQRGTDKHHTATAWRCQPLNAGIVPLFPTILWNRSRPVASNGGADTPDCQSDVPSRAATDIGHRYFDSHSPQPYNLGMDDVQTDAVTSLPSSSGSRRVLEMYRQMVLCRTLDERVWMLNRQGKAAIVASAQGHEAAQIGSVHALRIGQDHFYIYYRDLAVLVALGLTPREIMLGFTAKAGEPLAGARQFPTHGASPRHRMVNLSNVVGTQIPQAVGSALASKMRKEDTVTIVYFGDGASSVGDCHEAMNYAAVHKLPVIFLCENNGYAISVPLAQQMAVDSVAGRAEGYGMPGVVVDGTDIMAVYEATREAAERARGGEGRPS